MNGYPKFTLSNATYPDVADFNGTEKYYWKFLESSGSAQITEQISGIKNLYVGGSTLLTHQEWKSSLSKYCQTNGNNSYIGCDSVDQYDGDFELGMLINFDMLNSMVSDQVLASKYRCDNTEYKSWLIGYIKNSYLYFNIFYNNQNGCESLKLYGISGLFGVHMLNFTYEKQPHRIKVYVDGIMVGELNTLNLSARNNNQNARFLLGALADTNSTQCCFAKTSFDLVYFQNQVDTEEERQVKLSKIFGYTYENNIIPILDYKQVTQNDMDLLADSTKGEKAYYIKFDGDESRINYELNGMSLANTGITPTNFAIMPISDFEMKGRTSDGKLGYNFFNGHQALKNLNSDIIFHTGSRFFGMICRHYSDPPTFDECFLSIYKYNTFAKKLMYFMQDSTTNQLVLCIWYDEYNHTEEIWIPDPMLDGKEHFIGGGYSLEDKTMFLIVDNKIYTKYSLNLHKINEAIVGTDAALTIGTYYREDGQTLELANQFFLDSFIMVQKPFKISEIQGMLEIIKGS